MGSNSGCFPTFLLYATQPSVSYRDIAVDNEQLLSSHIKLAAQLIGFPVDDPEAFVVRVENGLEKLQLGLQSRNRHLALISGKKHTTGPDIVTYNRVQSGYTINSATIKEIYIIGTAL